MCLNLTLIRKFVQMNQSCIVKSSVDHKILPQNGYSIHYFVSGSTTGETIVFLHPAFTDHHAFNHQIDYFSERYRVITIDMLGHGLSQMEKSKDKLDATIHHIDAILKLEGIKSAHLVGVSMGSLLAQYFALQFPQSVSSVTVVGGYNISANNKEIQKAQNKELFKWIFKAIFSMDSLRRYLASVSVFNAEEKENFYTMAQNFTRKSFLAMSGLGKVIKERPDYIRTYPLLILCGRKDLKITLNAAKKWHDSDPTSDYFVIISAGHCANMDKPEEFNMILESFIEGK